MVEGENYARSDRSQSPERSANNSADHSKPAENQGSNLFITGLAQAVKEADLEELFSKYGRIDKVQIMRDPHENASRGFGFVNFADPAAATEALALDGHELMGKTLIVEKAKRQRARTPTPGQYRGPAHLRRERFARDDYSRNRYNDGPMRRYDDRRGGDDYARRGYDDYPPRRSYHDDPHSRYDDRRHDDFPRGGYDRRGGDDYRGAPVGGYPPSKRVDDGYPRRGDDSYPPRREDPYPPRRYDDYPPASGGRYEERRPSREPFPPRDAPPRDAPRDFYTDAEPQRGRW